MTGGEMTKQEILALDPSVEMGNLVATEVMKWHREGNHWVAPEGFWVKAEGLDGWYPWRDISAAWRVVEKVRKELFSIRLRFLNALQEQTKFTVAGTGEECLVAWPDVFWSITPEAICKAALLAKLEATLRSVVVLCPPEGQ
jgi:Phage ABA sandwich domain